MNIAKFRLGMIVVCASVMHVCCSGIVYCQESDIDKSLERISSELITDSYGIYHEEVDSIASEIRESQLQILWALSESEKKEIQAALSWLNKTKTDDWWENDSDPLQTARGYHSQISKSMGPNQPFSNHAKFKVAQWLGRQRKYEEAIELFHECVESMKSTSTANHPRSIDYKSQLADAYYWAGKFSKALEWNQQCVRDANRMKIPATDIVNLRMGVAKSQVSLGQFEQAETVYRTIIQELREDGEENSFLSANCSLLLGAMLVSRQEPGKAQAPLIESLEFFETNKRSGNPFRVTTRNYLAASYYKLGKLNESQELYHKSLKECEDNLPRMARSKAACIHWLGAIAGDIGDFAKQQEYADLSHEILVGSLGADHPNVQASIASLAFLHREAGNYTKAEQLYRQALENLNKSGALPVVRFKICFGLAICLFHTDQFEDAREQLLNCHELQSAHKLNRSTLIEVYVWEAEIALAMDETAVADEACQKAAGLLSSRGHHDDMDEIRLGVIQGEIATREGKSMAALEHFESTLEMARSRGLRFAALGSFANQKNQQRLQQEVFEKYCSLAVQMGEERKFSIDRFYSEVIQFKGQLTGRHRSKHKSASYDEFQLDLDRIGKLNSRVAKLFGNEQEKDLVRTMIKEKNELEQKIANRLGMAQEQKSISCDDVRNVLADNEVFLDFVTFRDGEKRELLVFIVQKDKPLKYTRLGDLSAIIEDLDVWTKGQGDSSAAQRAALKLRDVLWKPLSDSIEPGKEIVISADAAIALVPFAALPSGTPYEFLVQDHLFSYQISARSLVSSRTASPKADVEPKLLAFGNPKIGPTVESESQQVFPDLPASVDEIEAVKQLFQDAHSQSQSMSFLRSYATVESFIDNAGNCTHIHVATHGFWKGPELEKQKLDFGTYANTLSGCLVGLVFASRDGQGADALRYVTADDIVNLDLSRVEQVVLSGCNTGRGVWESGEATASLQRAFHVAGVRTVVASMWKVPDRETKQLMTLYYRNFLERGMTKAKALRQAQIVMLKKATFKSPYKWGSFFISGAAD